MLYGWAPTIPQGDFTMPEYTFIRSKRRTIGITVKADGSVILRAPLHCSKKRAEAFLVEKQE